MAIGGQPAGEREAFQGMVAAAPYAELGRSRPLSASGARAQLQFRADPGHIERRRAAPESKYPGQIPTADFCNQAENPRRAFARSYGGQAKLGMKTIRIHGRISISFHRIASAPRARRHRVSFLFGMPCLR